MRAAESIQSVHGRGNQPSRAGRKVLIFRLSGQAYGISVLRVREILPIPLLERAPGLPPVLAGFVNLGGKAIPVVNLARLFAVPEQPTARYTPLVILHCGEGALALLVDCVQGVVRLDDEQLVPFSDNLCLNRCAEGLATVGETHFVLLADDRLLREQEQRRIEQLAAVEQARLDGLWETSS